MKGKRKPAGTVTSHSSVRHASAEGEVQQEQGERKPERVRGVWSKVDPREGGRNVFSLSVFVFFCFSDPESVTKCLC